MQMLIEDLLAYTPLRYEDRSNLKPIAQLAPGEMATVIAEVRSGKVVSFRRKNLGIFEAVLGDGSTEKLIELRRLTKLADLMFILCTVTSFRSFSKNCLFTKTIKK